MKQLILASALISLQFNVVGSANRLGDANMTWSPLLEYVNNFDSKLFEVESTSQPTADSFIVQDSTANDKARKILIAELIKFESAQSKGEKSNLQDTVKLTFKADKSSKYDQMSEQDLINALIKHYEKQDSAVSKTSEHRAIYFKKGS
ncbi:hypothetical protein PQ465_04865 [Sphingobacterium oryzagri]|uniref:Uncharacterized protein n=1 Tax=Sphingobacterium oryzagri TaxID=3025669 RepID=A0ABY7WME4_9SPHI|nr:hypothetical protein [Sphingobacterium sp. KACC 22765]WDF69714.1 hypothetical protein PQ465_04865 [Sphingobacterium sp. KACC 22765]